MFNSVKEVQQADITTLIDLVESKHYNAKLKDILSEDLLKGYKAAQKVVANTDSLAEKIAYAIRDRVQDTLDEKSGDENDDINEFMNAIAGETGQEYNGEYENRPDEFWIPSTC